MGRELDDVDAALIIVSGSAGNAFVAEAGERLDRADIEANVLSANGVIDCSAQFPASREVMKTNRQDNIVIDGSMPMVASMSRPSCLRSRRRNRKRKEAVSWG